MTGPILFYSYLILAVLGLVGTWYYNLMHIASGESVGPSVAFANSHRGAKAGMRWPVFYVVAFWRGALAFSLPLFLAFRQKHIDATN